MLHASARGIEFESLTTRLVGGIDLQGLLALGDVPAGYQRIRIEMDIKVMNATDEELDDLLQLAQAHSPECNTVCRPVPWLSSGWSVDGARQGPPLGLAVLATGLQE